MTRTLSMPVGRFRSSSRRSSSTFFNSKRSSRCRSVAPRDMPSSVSMHDKTYCDSTSLSRCSRRTQRINSVSPRIFLGIMSSLGLPARLMCSNEAETSASVGGHMASELFWASKIRSFLHVPRARGSATSLFSLQMISSSCRHCPISSGRCSRELPLHFSFRSWRSAPIFAGSACSLLHEQSSSRNSFKSPSSGAMCANRL
mmetsp:Transcript_18683/g.55835  ORF Transcript_18683/g.55835 Transcript_18683/m.55835 type:complete len:201 (+) Transcript_18683:50-652(+)